MQVLWSNLIVYILIFKLKEKLHGLNRINIKGVETLKHLTP